MSKSIPIQQIFLNQIPIPEKLLTNYKSIGLNEQEVIVIIQLLHFFQIGNDFPTPNEIASFMTMEEKECAQILRKLIQKNILSIERNDNEQRKLSESYSLTPLFEKLYLNNNNQEDSNQTDGSIFILFEQEFGRPLSPFEIEMINGWLDEDQFEPSLIKAALRESVLMGKLNFKYIDRILREWKKKGIHTVEQARNATRNFHQKQNTRQENVKKRDTSVYYNWLEGED